MNECDNYIKQLYVHTQQFENVDIKNFINEIEQIGLLIIYSKK
jgi:hypothetical protein